MHLWTALALGLFGGIHCAGMCGPLVLALPGRAGGGYLAGRLAYQGGRIAMYCVLGVILGGIGRTLFLAGAQRWVSLSLGVALLAGVLLSPRVLEASWLAAGAFRLRRLMGRHLREHGLGSMTLLGALNGLLPCGLVYVAAAGSVATGEVLGGIAYMALFGLGTLPTLLGISLGGRLIPASARVRLRRLTPAVVVLLAVLLILRGLSLGIPYLSPAIGSGPPGATGGCCHPQPVAAAGSMGAKERRSEHLDAEPRHLVDEIRDLRQDAE